MQRGTWPNLLDLASQSAKHSNRMFKAKRIKDDLMLTDRQVNEVEQSTTAILKHLDAMEVTWSNKQKQKKKQRLRENLQKKVRANDFVDQLLVKCKEHGGPVTSVNEVKALVSKKSPELKTFLRQEIQYQRVTHQHDADVRRDLYKVNKISQKEMIENLTVLLGDDFQMEEAVVFPCEEEIVETLTGAKEAEGQEDLMFQPNQSVSSGMLEATKDGTLGFTLTIMGTEHSEWII